MNLIDRDVLKNTICDRCVGTADYCQRGYCESLYLVDSIPKVDAVPREEYERVCKERDAAVSDLVMCMHFSTKNNNVCNFCKKDMAEYPNKCAGWSDSCECNPEWRGTSKDEDDGQSIL